MSPYELVEKASDAIQDVFLDTRVDHPTTLVSLNSLMDEIQMMIEALGEDDNEN